MSGIRWGLAPVIAFGALGLAPADGPGPKKDVVELLGRLKKKRDSGGKHTYKLSFFTTGFDKGAPTGSCTTNKEFQIDWKSGRFRLAGWQGCSPNPFELIEIYDGEKLKTQFRDAAEEGKPTGAGAWKYGLITGRLDTRSFQNEYWPVFMHKGVLPGHADWFYPGHFVFDLDPATVFIDGEVTRDGRKCIVLKTFPEKRAEAVQFAFTIDPGKDDSVVALEIFRDEKRAETWDITVEAGKKGGGWALSGWSYTWWNTKMGVPNQTIRASVAHFTAAPSADRDGAFELAYPEGARVGQTHYAVPAGKTDIEPTFKKHEVRDGKLVPVP